MTVDNPISYIYNNFIYSDNKSISAVGLIIVTKA